MSNQPIKISFDRVKREFIIDPSTVGRAAWESDKPFCIDFNDRSPFKHLTLSSKLADDGKHRTREVQVRRRFPSGRYKYRVFVYDPDEELIRIDDCPDVGVDEDKC